MKPQFEIHEGQLFRMLDKPVPLTPDAELPCLVRLIQDDSRLGILNKLLHEGCYHEKYLCTSCNHQVCHILINGEEYDDFYPKYEIIGYPVAEGSAEWALYQMMQGKKVMNIEWIKRKSKDIKYCCCENGMLVYNPEYVLANPLPIGDFLTPLFGLVAIPDGWQIYKEPKPEPEVGKWYQHKKRKHYVCVVAVNGEECRIRFAGNPEGERYGWKENNDIWYIYFFESSYEPASLEPDFSDAKIGHKCFSVTEGSGIITDALNLFVDFPGINQFCHKHIKYLKNGKQHEESIHPSLFNSSEQCAAYFAEVALKERGE